jgi:hypothetical protein
MAGGGGGGGSGGIYLNGGKELASVTTWSQFHLHLAVSQAENKQKYLDLKEADFIASFQLSIYSCSSWIMPRSVGCLTLIASLGDHVS